MQQAVHLRRKALRLASPCCGTALRARYIRHQRRSLLGSINTGSTKFNTAIEYDTDVNRTAYSRVKHYINNGEAYSYTYDDAGNISKITDPNGTWVSYTYDALNQLIGEQYSTPVILSEAKDPVNGVTYQYDTRGNILSKTYTLTDGTTETINYGYTDTVWKDRLTSYNGISITADAIGNPLSWHDGATMSWQHGRQLATHTKNGVTTTYSYDDTGLRTSKTVGNVTTKYYVIDGTLRRLTTTDGNALQFVYGNDLSSVIFNGTEYWYVFNAQGDIVGLVDANGAYVVEYTYDAWGLLLSKIGTLADTLGTLNPFRYRGYIYDEESGFYYCQTRYYDPEIGRFLNSDNEALVTATLEIPHWDKNLFAYCDNNPIIRYDLGGEIWDFLDIISFAVSASEVILNPTDGMAWVNLAADTVDLLPLVTGVGEVTRTVRIADRTVEAVNSTTEVASEVKKISIASERSKAVRQAWDIEYDNVINGGDGFSRQWTDLEKAELLRQRKVSGYQGHHMYSVKGYPELAGDPYNIQFLTRREHLLAHGGNWRNITSGRYVTSAYTVRY